MYRELEFKKGVVFDEVGKITGMIGKKHTEHESSPEDSFYERVATTDDDRDKLSQFWKEGCNALIDASGRFYLENSDAENEQIVDMSEIWTLCLDLPVRTFTDNWLESARKSAYAFLYTFIAAEWFSITEPELAEQYQMKANNYILEYVGFINKRKLV